MANGPATTFAYADRLVGSSGVYTVGQNNQGASSYPFYDSDVHDAGGDSNLTQLGNVASDHFLINSFGATDVVYIGKTANGIVYKTVSNGAIQMATNVQYAQGQQLSSFVADDPNDASTWHQLCFATGTLIKTARGEVAVEDLREGENVITASGEARAIQWIGHRRTDCAHHPRPKDVWPVLVEAGALGNATPERDLYLTPYHAVALTCGSEVLVPIHCLINGTTIRQVPVDEITYWHVELETHDILVANGAAAESYLDTGNRTGFENAEGHVDLHPDFKPADDADFCRPLVTSGPILAALRASLADNLSCGRAFFDHKCDQRSAACL